MIRGEYLLYSKHSPGGGNAIQGGGEFCYVQFVPWGKICYIANIPGECLLYSKTSGGSFARGKVYYIPPVRNRTTSQMLRTTVYI